MSDINLENPELQVMEEPIIPHSTYLPPKQSANVLFNFMKKLDYLKMIIRNKALIPRYNMEDISYLKLPRSDSISSLKLMNSQDFTLS